MSKSSLLPATFAGRLTLGLTSIVVLASTSLAQAQTFPSRPVTLIVPYAAGGPTDTLARIISEPMRVALGVPVVVENVVGGAGSVATGRASAATPDGQTIIIGNWGTHVLNGALQALKHDLLGDFTPVAFVADNPHVIVSKTAVPASDLKGLIAWVKANQDKATAANSGAGAPSHISGLYFQKLTGTKFPFVAYRGAGPAIQDMVGGQIDLFFDQISNALPSVKSGSIRAYAIASPKRSAAAPDVPTVDEAGLPGFHVSVWHAVWAPKRTDAAVVAKLNDAVMKALADTATRQRLAELGQEIPSAERQSSAALATFHKSEIEKWWPLIKAENIAIQ